MESHAIEEYGVEPATLIAEYGPDVMVATGAATPAPARPAAADDDEPADPVPADSVPADSVLADDVPAGAAVAAQPGSLAEALRAVTDAARAQSNGERDSNGAQRRRKEAEPDVPAAVPYVRQEQQKRAAEAERQLARLGKVNPLALEEFAALRDRHQFLATQLEDLRKTRRDLLTVVKEVDDRVQEVFASAYADTAREFEAIFSRLFPGGAGRLLLTEPDDMLTTGIEIEARPPGKKVKRLSLLSGGERSLTAIAYLFAIFKARPSPFYVLDEVEAALDDSNLQRLLRVFEELRESSQLIVITHQRRTMEAADALYGVSMRGDGVSQVISQRMREPEPV
jgi:chromosome segregation protein